MKSHSISHIISLICNAIDCLRQPNSGIWRGRCTAAKEIGLKVVALAMCMLLPATACDGYAYAATLPETSMQSPEVQQNGVSRRQHNRPVGRPVHNAASAAQRAGEELPDSIPMSQPLTSPSEVVEDEIDNTGRKPEVIPVDTFAVDLNMEEIAPQIGAAVADSIRNSYGSELTAGEAWTVDSIAAADSLAVVSRLMKVKPDEWEPRKVEFAPDPTRAVWMSALFPGLGQVYNRRYWKLPIIVGGYLGLAYATSWNNTMLRDYTVAYNDLLDNDPNTNSYMDLFGPNVTESMVDKSWLRNVLRSRKNYFRRNRDLCIICMVGVYLLSMVDAYVDASLSHFDITPELSVDVAPAMIQDGRQRYPSLGLMWAFTF